MMTTTLNTTVPAISQNTKVLNDLKKVKVGDSIQFRPAQGGEPILMRITQIGTSKTNPSGPRMFVGEKRGKQVYALENTITRVITRSVDNEADWIDPKFVKESDTNDN